MGELELLLVGLAAVAGGAVNALAGGGTLITFPMLTAVGVPAVAANVTNTVALCPGYLGGSLAQLNDLRGNERRMWLLVPAGMIGGIAGGILLLNTGERVFRSLVPFLILLAAGLLAAQDSVRAWLTRRAEHKGSAPPHEMWTVLPVGIAAVYGGYFGAGLSVIVLAVLGLVIDESLTRLNAIKQVIALVVNIAAAAFFLFSDQVMWSAAAVMAVGALIGEQWEAALREKIRPAVLRRIVVAIGVVVAGVYLVR